MFDADRVASRDLTIGVVGLGYVGLPTALGFHDAGFRIRGLDVSERIVEALATGRNPGDDAANDDAIPAASENWMVSSDPAVTIPDCDVILVTVPTPVTSELKPDLSFVEAAGRSVFDHLARNERIVVVLESTVYPGVTRDVWCPLLEERGLSEGVDVELAYCPERFVPGDPEHGVSQVPRVVGAVCDEVAETLVHLYSTLTTGAVSKVGSIEVAEASKVVENVQRDLNIALVNELALILPRLGLDVEEVLSAAATKWNFHRYSPGVGVGGHCIPVDPHYLIRKAAEAGAPTDLISAARAVNASMPAHAARTVLAALEERGVPHAGASVLILGWAYKPGISDARETPAEPLALAFEEAGCRVSIWDPLIQEESRSDIGFDFADDPYSATTDAVILCTAHGEVLDLDWTTLFASSRTGLLYDGRRVLDRDSMLAAGWDPIQIGRP